MRKKIPYPFKCTGRSKVGQKAPIVDHCKINTSTQPYQNKDQPTPWGRKIVIKNKMKN
jgi:hypothetical protein